MNNSFLAGLLISLALVGFTSFSKPLYRDPVYDGPADPGIIQNRRTGEWYMFYTSRRANSPDLDGVSWAHGTPIGMAKSEDLAHWTYQGRAKINYSPDSNPSYWAPSIIDDGKFYHMFLTYVPGTFSDWEHPRYIIHLTSRNLKNWIFRGRLQLGSDRVIDADVQIMPDGSYRMWYNQEPGGKLIASADSPDLNEWRDNGPIPGIGACEAPKVFYWHGFWWTICDEWHGLAVYRSDDASNWTRQSGNILESFGSGTDDGAYGRHCEVIVRGSRAYIFYFTHPDENSTSGGNPRRSVIQAAELDCSDDGIISCDRDKPVIF